MAITYFILFGICCAALYFAGNWVVDGLARIAKIMGWKEFIAAFFIMATASTLPNLFLAIIAIINGVPELSMGDVMGGNVVDMTLAIALAAFFSRDGIDTKNKIVQSTLNFTVISSILPLFLMLDGNLSRFDGLILIGFFAIYIYWFLSQKGQIKSIYNGRLIAGAKKSSLLMKDFAKIAAGAIILLATAQIIVNLSNIFSNDFGVSLQLVGLMIVGLGNSFPETYFGIMAVRGGKANMLLGDIMGAIILPGTLVLGMVALISPIQIQGVNMFAAARYFLLVAAVVFYICVKSDRQVTKKEGVILLAVYIGFLLTELFIK